MVSTLTHALRPLYWTILALLLVPAPWLAASAAEVKVLSITGVRALLPDLAAVWEKETGNKVTITYDSILPVAKRISDGEAWDVVVLPQDRLEPLAKQGKVTAASIASLVHVPMGAGVPPGSPKPDIATGEALKRALLAAASVTYPDPANGTPSGLYFPPVLVRLGIADQINAKAKLSKSGGDAVDILAAHGAALGFASIGDFTGKAAELIGPLPAELKSEIVYSAGAIAGSHEPQAARAFVTYITSPAAAPVIKAKGMQP
jgi:molybdate transport system substrate-binding protein